MKTLIKISAWILIIFGLLFLVVSMILTIASVIRIGNPGVAARILLPRFPAILTTLIQGLLLVGMGEVVYLLLHINENTVSDPISKNAKADSPGKKK